MMRLLPALALCAFAAPAWPQMPGQKGGFGATDSRGSREAIGSPSNPGVAPPLDIRIQDEGLRLPRGVSEDDRPEKPPVEAKPAPQAPAGAINPQGAAK